MKANSAILTPSSTSDPTTTIRLVDQQSAALAVPPPLRLNIDAAPWLERWRTRKGIASTHRDALVGAAKIAIDRQLKAMEIAAEGAILMAKTHWEGLVQLHGAQQTQQFASIFLDLQDRFMSEVVDATQSIFVRASNEAERIESSSFPDFVKATAREENERRFRLEMETVKTISERIGSLLSTRLGQAGAHQ